MSKSGNWSLSPAFDVTYSFNPAGAWTASHQMTLNGKRDAFTCGCADGVAGQDRANVSVGGLLNV